MSEHPDDRWEKSRVDERISFGLDIGSGANKILGLGCDLRKITDVQCDMSFLPFKNESFVIAVFRHSLEHTEKWKEALEEAKRVAQQVYVILPRWETWHLDRSHVKYFEIKNAVALKKFKLGVCYHIKS